MERSFEQIIGVIWITPGLKLIAIPPLRTVSFQA
jgi:hypothetical protein